jgi:hypothetical protein
MSVCFRFVVRAGGSFKWSPAVDVMRRWVARAVVAAVRCGRRRVAFLAPRWWGEFQLEVDLASMARARAKAEASQQRASRTVLPLRRCRQTREAVLSRALRRPPRQRRANAHALQIVGDRDSYVRDTRAIGELCVAADADDRAVALVDGGDRLVRHMIDIGEVVKLARCQFVLGREESPAARLGSEPREQGRHAVTIVGADRPEAKTRAISENQHERLCSGRRG